MNQPARLQHRIQRYGWDLAATAYEPLWRQQLSAAHEALLALARPARGDHVLDVASGTGLIAFAVADDAGVDGRVLGVDISARMVEEAGQRARQLHLDHVQFQRMGGEQLDLPDASFDLVYCALGLMYMPDPDLAMREIHRVLRPGGRAVLAVWGERSRCGWSPVFPIVDAEVRSEVCPMFFQLGYAGALTQLCVDAGFACIREARVVTTLHYDNAEQACDAAFVGGPVAMAWSRFDAPTRQRVQQRYLQDIAQWRDGVGYQLPGEFVVAIATKPVE